MSSASSTPSTSAAAPAPPPPPPLPRVFFAVTGFGPFAGVKENPTQKVVEGLRQRAAAEEQANKDKEANNTSGSSSPPSPSFSLSRSVVKAEVLRVSAADVERWVRVDLEEAARAVAEEVEKGAEAAARAGAEAEAEAEKATTTATTAATTTDAAPSTSPPPPSSSRPYHFVAVHLGVYASATTPQVRLETRAHNSANFRIPDADGAVLVRQPITTTKSARRRKELDQEERERRLESGLPLARVALRLSSPSSSEEQEAAAAAAGPPSSSSPPRPPPPPRPWTVATTDDAGRYLCNFIYWHSLCACRREAAAGEAKKEGQEKNEEGKPLASLLRRPLATLFRRGRQKGGQEQQGRRIVRHAVFVHLPPAAVLPVESQLEFVERLLRVLAEELS